MNTAGALDSKWSLPPLPEEPLVSVLTTSYNHRRWVQDTVDSVACQTYRNVEHVIVDDGSTDGSQELLGGIAGERAHVYSFENCGQARALNHAFELSHGQIIGWVSSDDVYFSPRVIERVVRVFLSHPEVAAVYGHAVMIDSDGLILKTTWAPPHTKLARKLLHIGFCQPTLFVRRDAIQGDFVDPAFDLLMDAELYARLSRDYQLRRLGSILAADRHHPDRKTYTLVSKARQEKELLHSTDRYGPSSSVLGLLLSKLFYRAMGTTLVHAATTEEPAFAAHRDGARRLLRRQLLRRRRDMGRGVADGPVRGRE